MVIRTCRPALVFFAVVLLSPAISAWAAEGASTEYVPGFAGFAAGFVPPIPGYYFADDIYLYHGSTSAVALRGRVALDISTDAYLDVAEFNVVTPWKILGGNYAVAVAVAGGYINVGIGIDPFGFSRSISRTGFGDMILIPALVGWHAGNWHCNYVLSVFAPTGQYDPNAPLNLSKHFWAIDNAGSVSYLTPTGLDLSGSLGYTVNFENPTTHYTSGDVLHLDLAFGQNLSKEFKLGVVAYAEVQVTGDSGSGATLGSFESNIYGAGPALNYTAKVGNTDISMQLRWYHEFGAKNHLEGNAVYLIAALAL